MEDLIRAIRTTPIVDNHAHPLLKPFAQDKYPFLAITTEAGGAAMNAAPSTLAHIRAVNQLSKILQCPATWDDVTKAIQIEKEKPDDAWAKRCLEGVETILVDDGLDGEDEVYDYVWHDRLVKSKCKRIVRIEKVAEKIIDEANRDHTDPAIVALTFLSRFEDAIEKANCDPEVVGFKSVICYRGGLNILPLKEIEGKVEVTLKEEIAKHKAKGNERFKRLENPILNSYLVHYVARVVGTHKSHPGKPLQFHTGLGDNDITLTTSSPSHLQEFIREYNQVPIVLLHASYPWTKEAGYLATVYENVYADIGEIFPFLSKEGQEKAVREILELCPSEKVMWSTDGHWFPETYLLAVIQVREAFEVVLSEYVRDGALNTSQAIKLVRDIFFDTSNKLYKLKLPFKALSYPPHGQLISIEESDLSTLTSFLKKYPSTNYLRLQYVDYTASPKLRVIPVRQALKMLQGNQKTLNIGITKASLALLQNDTVITEGTPTGEYRLQAILSSLRVGPTHGYASVQCEFRELDGSEAVLCPRTYLRRACELAKHCNFTMLLGFEIEVVFLSRISTGRYDGSDFKTLPNSGGHAWSSQRALQDSSILKMIEEIDKNLSSSDIFLEQWHPESSTGQYEFILPPLSPLEAVDTLLLAREIISTVAAKYSLRATLHPKPFPNLGGTGSHVHMSLISSNEKQKDVYESFYAGILKRLNSIVAFTYSNPVSYERAVDGCWAGGRWVTWGTQNRETPLRKITGSHWEMKCFDGLANPYLALGYIIAAGSSGVLKQEPLTWKDCEIDPAKLSFEQRSELGITQQLPPDFKSALNSLQKSSVPGFSADVISRYSAIKIAEMKMLEEMSEEVRRDWIIERY